ncbi:MAG: class I SAM-dependent methyltransferase [Pseudomonadota bacterium]
MNNSRGFRQITKSLVPRPVIRTVWNACGDLKDLPKRLFHDLPPQPLRMLHNSGGGDYHQIGHHIVRKIIKRTGFASHWSVLDIGCGTGRIAGPMISRLDERGAYTGFDVSRSAIDWARKYVAPDAANVRFVHADLANQEYNPGSSDPARLYAFPCTDESVDLGYAVSVFTHLRAPDAQAYLHQSARVLKPGGKLFLTAFLMTPDALERTQRHVSAMPFEAIDQVTYSTDPRVPEQAMAFDEQVFLGWVQKAGFRIVDEIRRGCWSTDRLRGELQDELVLEKRAISEASGA